MVSTIFETPVKTSRKSENNIPKFKAFSQAYM